MELSLNKIEIGDSAKIIRLDNEGSMKRRLLDLGFINGTKVTCLFKSRHGDPAAFLVRDTVIAIRKEDSEAIFVEKL